LQNSNDTANSVAKNEPVAEKVKGPSGVSSEGEAPISETYPTNSVNTAMPAATVAPTSTNSSTVSNSTVSSANVARAAEPKPVATPVVDGDADRGITSGSTSEKSADNKKDKTAAKEEVVTKGGESIQPEYEVAAKPAPRANDDTVQRADNVQNNRATQNQIMTPDGAEARRNAPSAPPAAKKREVTSSEGEGAKTNRDEVKTSSTRTVAGKTFSNVNGAWTDSAYKGGSATSVRRGTDEYKKLDSGLRSTADYLGGTVVIVWKGKNYKIQ
jgi:hypothetical protein